MNAALDLRIRRPEVPVPESDWTWKTEAEVVRYMIDRSGLKEKAVAIEIGTEPSTLARAKQGTARLSEDSLQRLMDCTGSNAWLIYQMLRRNKDPRFLKDLESEADRKLREAEERIAQLERDKQVLTEALTGRASP